MFGGALDVARSDAKLPDQFRVAFDEGHDRARLGRLTNGVGDIDGEEVAVRHVAVDRLEDGGSVRRCVRFSGEGSVVCDPDDGKDPTRGFEISMDIRPTTEGKGGVLASFGDSFSLELLDLSSCVETRTELAR